jgi:tetratricopeptide (TPR) repeat protein
MQAIGRKAAQSSTDLICFPPFRLDLREQRLWRGERLVPLEPRAFLMLRCLLERPGELLTHDELLARGWGDTHLRLAKLPQTPALAQLELELLLLLATPLRLTKGFGAPELERTYARAAELCERDVSPQRRFLVLAGRGALHLTRAEDSSALALGRQFLGLAQNASDPRAMAHAHSMIGAACHFMGQHREAVLHLDQAIAFYDTETAIAQSSTTIDLGQAARGTRALSLWHMGYIDRARRYAEENLQHARSIQNPYAVAYAYLVASGIYLECQQLDESLHYAQCAGAICADQNLDMFHAVSLVREGMVFAARAEFPAAIELMERGLAAYTETGSRAYSARWSARLAWSYHRVGQSSRALEILREAQRETSPALNMSGAELLRLEGHVLLATQQATSEPTPSPEQSSCAETCFSRALVLAREQGAKSLELRAAMSLAEHWAAQGQTARAHALLSEIHSWFSEGHDTNDLKTAQSLLEKLQPNEHPLPPDP